MCASAPISQMPKPPISPKPPIIYLSPFYHLKFVSAQALQRPLCACSPLSHATAHPSLKFALFQWFRAFIFISKARLSVRRSHICNINNIRYISYRSEYKEKSRDIAVSALEGGDDLLSRFRSTIGAMKLNFSVRDGKRWILHAIITLISLWRQRFCSALVGRRRCALGLACP